MACGSFTCSKNALAALNVLYILVAFIMIGVAAYGKAAVFGSLSILGGIIACGVFLLIVALIGLVGAIKHHQVLLFFYMIILFVVFLIQFSVACACLAIDKSQQQKLAESTWRRSSATTKTDLQKLLDCCGFSVSDQDDVADAPMGHPACQNEHYNVSGCEKSEAVCCVGLENMPDLNVTSSDENVTNTEPNTCPAKPCFLYTEENMDKAIKTAGGVSLFFSFTEIIGVWLAMKYRNLKDPRANPSAFL